MYAYRMGQRFVHASLQYIPPNKEPVWIYRVGQSDIVCRLDGLWTSAEHSSEQLRVKVFEEGSMNA